MKTQIPQIYLSESEEVSPSPTLQAASMPASTDSTSSKDTCFIYGTTIMPSVSLSPSPTLAARRADSRSQTPLGKMDFEFQQSIDCRYNHLLDQSHRQSLTPPLTTMDISSPTFVAARDYYLNLSHRGNIDTPPQSGTVFETSQRKSSVLQVITQYSSAPRRHSVAIDSYPEDLEHMKDLKLRALEIWRRGSATPPSRHEGFDGNTSLSKPTANRERWMQKVFHDENSTPEHSPSLSPQSISTELPELLMKAERQIHNPLEPQYLGNIPFSYTTNKLREWGDVYLFNTATADAFIRAIPIPVSNRQSPPPLSLHQSLSDFSLNDNDIKEEDVKMCEPPPTAKQIVKVKVVPQCRNRKSFFMQKAFPVRKSVTSQSSRISKHASPRYNLRHRHENHQGKKVEALRNAITEAERRPAVPIHIEYALYRTPLLAAVLLCEYVKRGDTIEIPLPFPEAWEEVVEWVYTGKTGADVSAKVRETVEYLGGRI